MKIFYTAQVYWLSFTWLLENISRKTSVAIIFDIGENCLQNLTRTSNRGEQPTYNVSTEVEKIKSLRKRKILSVKTEMIIIQIGTLCQSSEMPLGQSSANRVNLRNLRASQENLKLLRDVFITAADIDPFRKCSR